jgi:hypothetical protein
MRAIVISRWRKARFGLGCPDTVVIVSVVDLDMPSPLALAWRMDNTSPLLASFEGEVRKMV